MVDLSGAQWRRSSFSDADAECAIEVAFLPDGHVAVRPTNDDSVEPHVFTPFEWECFVAGVRAGEFDHP